MANWKEKLSVFERKYVVKEIGNTTWHFYPISLGRMFELKKTIKEVFGATAVLLGKRGDDVTQEIENIKQGDSTISRTNIGAISPELAKMRDDQKRTGIEAAIESLLSEHNKLTLGRMLTDSLREDFARDVQDPEITTFIATLDLDMTVQMVMGLVEANAKVFGPLGQRAKSAIEKKLGELPLGDGDEPVQSAPQPSTPAQ